MADRIPWESSSLTTEFKFFGDQGSGQGPSGQEQKATATKAQSAARSMDDWRKELRGKDPKVAYELVVADDSVPAYEAFVALFAQPPYNMRVRVQLERRYVMEAWSTAVAMNTAASYQAFLAKYPDSDLSATARTMQTRVRNRSFGAALANVALGPTCPCPVEPLKKKLDEPRKRVETPRVRKPPTDVVETKRRPEPGIPPEAIMQGIGMGIAIGGALSGGGGSSGGPQPHSEGHPH